MKRIPSLALCALAAFQLNIAQAQEPPPPPPAAPPPPPVEAPAAPPPAPLQQGPAPTKQVSSATDQVVEGELSSLGSTKLVLKDTRLGVLAGPALIGQSYYLSGSIEFDLQVGQNFGLGLATPVNIPVYDPTQGFKLFPYGLKLRWQDYQTASGHLDPAKLVRILRYLTIGHKEGDFFLNFSTDYAATIGHGTAIRRYVTNINLDDARLMGEIDAKFKYGGFELMVGNVVTPLNMMGALLYLKPAGGSPILALQRLSFGLEYAGDWFAPLKLQTIVPSGPSAYPLLDSTGDQIAVAHTAGVHVVGLSVETKVVKTDKVDIKPYVDYSQMFVTEGNTASAEINSFTHGKSAIEEGAGLTAGLLGRFGFGGKIHNAVRLVAEARLFQPNYIPGYFDSFYEVQKYQYITNGAVPVTQVPTKLASVMSRAPGQTLLPGAGCGPSNAAACPSWIPGVYGEVTYDIVGAFAITAAAQYAGNNLPGGTDLVLHLEVPTWDWLRFFGSIYRLNLSNQSLTSESFPKQLTEDNTLIFAGARVRLLPILWINAQYERAWLLDQTGTSNSYGISNALFVTIELGFEFTHG